jgi:hypothetical protein
MPGIWSKRARRASVNRRRRSIALGLGSKFVIPSGRTNFECIVVLLEFDAVPVEKSFAPEEDGNVSINENHRRFKSVGLVSDAEGQVTHEPVNRLHRYAQGDSLGTLVTIDAKCLGNRRGHHDLIRSGIYESQELAGLIAARQLNFDNRPLRVAAVNVRLARNNGVSIFHAPDVADGAKLTSCGSTLQKIAVVSATERKRSRSESPAAITRE